MTKTFGDMQVKYVAGEDGVIGLELLPQGLTSVAKKGYKPLSLAQIKIIGEEAYRGLFPRGRTMMNSNYSLGFKLKEQQEEENTVTTVLVNGSDHQIRHVLNHEGKTITTKSIFTNDSTEDIYIEMLSSFCLGGLTPYEEGDAPESMVLHRVRSRWADEGRLESIPIEDLQLEPSFSRVAVNSITFGQTGTMPVREFFPFVAVEDVKRNVTWGAQLAWPGSWQMEVYRLDDALCIAGGLADRNNGQWIKKIAPGESFETPEAIITVGIGGVDEISQRLTSYQLKNWLTNAPASEKTAPAALNEFCTTWGWINHDSMMALANRVKDTGVKYLVMDAGWYDAAGDYNINPERFPHGFDTTLDEIKKLNQIPGIWFEYEVAEERSKAFSDPALHLTLDGNIIYESGRHFLDMRKESNHERLTKMVIEFLKRHKIPYIKIDYNANIGFGCDGAESPGEGLRQHIEGVIKFVKKIKEEIPEIVIENCASGGHRLEPLMMGLSSMASFSDAHETINIPLIAANLHRVIAPVQSQVWAVARPKYSIGETYYYMAAGLLGRFCISGDINDISDEQWDVCKNAIAVYEKIAPILIDGLTTWYGPKVKSYRHPKGWQGIVRANQAAAYAVIHTFGDAPDELVIDAPKGMQIAEIFAENLSCVSLKDGKLVITNPGDFAGIVVIFKV